MDVVALFIKRDESLFRENPWNNFLLSTAEVLAGVTQARGHLGISLLYLTKFLETLM
jgi:hypothetical protein